MSRYALPADLRRLALSGNALAPISSEDQQAALDAASTKADSYLGAAFRLPLTAWGDDIRLAVCQIAAFALLTGRGYNPSAGGNPAIQKAHDDAIDWLEGVAAQKFKPTGVSDSAPSAVSVSRVSSRTPRGWDQGW